MSNIYKELYEEASAKRMKMASLIGYLQGTLIGISHSNIPESVKETIDKTLKELDRRWKDIQQSNEITYEKDPNTNNNPDTI